MYLHSLLKSERFRQAEVQAGKDLLHGSCRWLKQTRRRIRLKSKRTDEKDMTATFWPGQTAMRAVPVFLDGELGAAFYPPTPSFGILRAFHTVMFTMNWSRRLLINEEDQHIIITPPFHSIAVEFPGDTPLTTCPQQHEWGNATGL